MSQTKLAPSVAARLSLGGRTILVTGTDVHLKLQTSGTS